VLNILLQFVTIAVVAYYLRSFIAILTSSSSTLCHFSWSSETYRKWTGYPEHRVAWNSRQRPAAYGNRVITLRIKGQTGYGAGIPDSGPKAK
jgi:hypothetical protein